ncbi:hypothetical protein [Aurantiacibacter suaedae]|uniref:hypothetical protein n=1 Tax=Aurantiacibacter suaedae TaxID=2545755 RepID=UPI0010F48C7F|nr:hypothetical protein [Aurantiacibacter suaedae]
MKITIGKFDSATGTVLVTFDHEGITHRRPVNACLTENGGYDKTATAARVDDVARGVEHKIAIGLFAEPPEANAAP